MSKSQRTKARHFAFLIYPESAPENWKDKLENIGVPMAISPMHNKDQVEHASFLELTDYQKKLYAQKKLYKKPHFHVVYIANNPVTADSVRKKIQRALTTKAVQHVEIVDNLHGAFKYLTHESKDAVKKHKHVYDKKDLVLLNNFDINRYVTLDETQKKEACHLLIRFVKAYKITNMSVLMDFFEETDEPASFGLPDLDKVLDIIAGRSSILRLLFDGNFHQYGNPYRQNGIPENLKAADKKVSKHQPPIKIDK